MSDPNAFGYSGGEETMPGSVRPQAPMGNYKFTQDELKVLQQCNSESFYQRSLPLGTMLGLGAYAAFQKGYLKPNQRFGAFPKITLAVVIGYFAGKLSYQEACAEKLMALPDSYIGQLLREKKEGKSGRLSRQNQTPTMFGAGPGDIYSDAGPGSSLNLDTDRPLFNEDSYSPGDSGSNVKAQQDPQLPQKPTVSYEEIRRKNRGEYNDTRQDPYRIDPSFSPPTSRAKPQPPKSQSTNKYGDDIME